ncbi:DEAD/DEAH box helicase [Zhaonella formicivorans]|uniref:DEAD/DEAH box helicase n=1 Tax=Zhaonella formicivorans TaxID=2528593 RepID=UPI0010E6FB23|nr:DEAD/DEAH box helicase [Zhaonella formicivorans]
MKGKPKLKVFCRWEPSQGFLLWSKPASWNNLNLKLNLFAWHSPSFYGTFLPETVYEGKKAIQLSPVTALDFFAHLPEPEFFSVEWSKEIQLLAQIAPVFKELLVSGSWLPDYDKWQKGKTGWKLVYPQGMEKRGAPSYLEEWLDAIIPELIGQNQELAMAWQALMDTYPLLRLENHGVENLLSEEDWLEAIGWKQDHTPFITCLQLREPEGSSSWSLNIVLQDKENPHLLVPYEQNQPTSKDNYPEHWRSYLDQPEKQIQKWTRLLPWLKDQSVESGIIRELTEEQAWEFLNSGSMQLAEAGFTVFLPAWWEQVRKERPKLKAKTKSSVGSLQNSLFGLEQIVQFDWKLAIGDLELSVEEFNRLAEEKRRLMQIKGRWIQLDPLLLQQIKKTLKAKRNGMSLGEVLRLHLLAGDGGQEDSAGPSESMEHPFPVEVELNSQLGGMISQLTEISRLPLLGPPQAFQGVLRGYQRVGYSWLMFLRRFGLGGCLADDMGLGKTIQLIAYLLGCKEEGQDANPFLLICPTSVIGNWQMELKRFAPGLKVYLHYGPQRVKGEDFAPAVLGKDLVITSYTLAHHDREELTSLDWGCICLDEAQNIKNAYTKQAVAIRSLRGNHRIALTGTPMENRLTELWSIMDFLNPGYLGSLTAFTRKFVNVIEKSKDAQAVSRVKRLVQPFLLRRVKTDPAIELDLPEKEEFKEYVTLTAEQASLYENIIADMFERLTHAEGMEKRGIILAALTKLKQVCDHPNLILKENRGALGRGRSAKVARLVEMVEELRAEGDRCLIFTQFAEMGHLLQEILQKELKEPVQFLHGGTPKGKRDAMIARFQDRTLSGEEACAVFILSLKAGGTGLNLTAANHVFHFDRWWNPAVENQATDRVYRIGQNRHVLVHKFITLGTLEERIDELIEQKQGLNELIVGVGENWITELSTAELREIFALRKEWVSVD